MSWGPWIEHDGKGCPVPVGTHCLILDFGGYRVEVVAGCSDFFDGFTGPHGKENSESSCWVWGPCIHPTSIKKYRVRKPKGLSALQRIAQHPHKERIEA